MASALAVLAAARWASLAATPARIALLAGLGAVVAAVLFRLGRGRADSDVALWLARRQPKLGGAIADALELSGRNVGDSGALVRAHADQVATWVSTEDPRRAARDETPSLQGRMLAASLLLLAVTGLLVPQGLRHLVTGPPPEDEDFARYDLVQATYRAPAYLELEPRTATTQGDLKAPAGSIADLVVHADRELSSARLEVEGGLPRQMVVEGRDARVSLEMTGPGRYRIRLQGQTGGMDSRPALHVIDAVADTAPEVRLRSPADEILLDPGENIPLSYTASDDHGVTEIVLVVAPEGGLPASEDASDAASVRRIPLETLDPPRASRSDSRTLTPAQIGLEPGLTLELRLEARDGDTVAGPKWGRSRTVRVALRSEQAARSRADDATMALAEAILSLLGDHLVAEPVRLASHEARSAAYRGFNEKLSTIVAAFPEVVAALRADDGSDPNSAEALDQMRSRLQSLLNERRLKADAPAIVGDAPRLLAALQPLHGEEVIELERDALFFDLWADHRAAIDSLDALAELEKQVEDLEARLSASDEARAVEESGARLDSIERLTGNVREQARDAARAVPDSSEAAARAEQAGQALKSLIEAAKKARAQRDAKELRHIAAEMRQAAGALAESAGSLADARSMGDPQLAADVQALREDLKKLRRRQADLRDKTNALRDQSRRNMPPELRERLEKLGEDLIALADAAMAEEARGETEVGDAKSVKNFFEAMEEGSRIERRLSEMDIAWQDSGTMPEAAEIDERQALLERQRELMMRGLSGETDVPALMRLAEGSRDWLGRTRQTLADKDFGSARGPARSALANLEALAAQVQAPSDSDVAPAGARFEASAARTSEIIDKLEQMETEASAAAMAALTDAQRAELRGVASEQQGLLGEAQRVLSEIGRLSADAPFLGEETSEHVGRAAGQMNGAHDELLDRNPAPASEKQGQAVSELDQAEKALSPRGQGSRSRSPTQTAGRMGREGRRGASREEVAIPGAEAYKVPREFREEVLEAMRETAAPAGFEEAVREYYRRLVE